MTESTKPDWLYDNQGNLRPEWTNRSPENPLWEELERKGLGWKLHLNFDADNHATTHQIQTYLEQLQANGEITVYKLGKGGGKKSGAPGKEATVYVGPKDKAVAVATSIEENIGVLLDTPEGDTLIDDTPLTAKIMARFDIGRHDPDFHQYGAEGVPYLNHDMDPFNRKERRVALANAEAVLRERYGEYYTGSAP